MAFPSCISELIARVMMRQASLERPTFIILQRGHVIGESRRKHCEVVETDLKAVSSCQISSCKANRVFSQSLCMNRDRAGRFLCRESFLNECFRARCEGSTRPES